MELSDGLRVDGRRALELRQIRVRMGVFSQPDGSAYLEQGNTKVLAAVYGPHQPKGSQARSAPGGAGSVNCQYSAAVFSFSAGERKRRPRGDRKSQEQSLQLRRAMEAIIHLELFPRSQIDVFVEVLQADGSNYCAAVNAATLALIDAGIPIKDYAIGCTATLSAAAQSEAEDDPGKGKGNKGSGIGVVDASNSEENAMGATLAVVALPGAPDSAELAKRRSAGPSAPAAGLVVVAHGGGQRLHLSRLEALWQRALQGCRDTREILDRAVREHLATHSAPVYNVEGPSID